MFPFLSFALRSSSTAGPWTCMCVASCYIFFPLYQALYCISLALPPLSRARPPSCLRVASCWTSGEGRGKMQKSITINKELDKEEERTSSYPPTGAWDNLLKVWGRARGPLVTSACIKYTCKWGGYDVLLWGEQWFCLCWSLCSIKSVKMVYCYYLYLSIVGNGYIIRHIYGNLPRKDHVCDLLVGCLCLLIWHGNVRHT